MTIPNPARSDPGTGNCEPDYNCALCPRLKAFRDSYKQPHPDWHNGPVASFSPPDGDDKVQLLVIGLAPGLKGANRTGRPFTGDYAGDLFYSTLLKFGFAKGEYAASRDDGLMLTNTAITNSVRCVPPDNKPIGSEINHCRSFLIATIARFQNVKVMVTLGKIAHESTVRALGARLADHPFGHGRATMLAGKPILSTYHCSRYNTNTGRLTAEMFEAVFAQAREMVRV